MANKNKKKVETKKQLPEINWSVDHARQWKDNGITFALNLELEENRICTIYGCRIIEGKNGNFISFPSRKGTDGKYYSHAYIALTGEETEEIIEAVMDELEDAE